jgi:hypothetical protein
MKLIPRYAAHGLLFLLPLLQAAPAGPGPLPLEEVGGVYAITGDRMFSDDIWNLKITGVSVRTYWNKIEPERGRYDWSYFDRVVEAGRRHQKKVKLFVLFGVGVPRWTGARFITGSAGSEGDAAGARIPVPWDPELIKAKQEFIRVFAARYRDEPQVAFLHAAGPSAMWAELALPDNLTREEGYSNEAILGAWKQIIDTWAEVRGNKRVSISVSAAPPFYKGLSADIVAYAGGTADRPGRIGEAFLPQWCYLDSRFARSIRGVSATFGAGHAIGWQMWGATTWPSRRCEDYPATLQLADEVGSSLVEIYDADLNQPELARQAEALDARIKQRLRNRASPQAAGLRASFRAGQTFLTWQEAGPAATYRVYRSSRPIASPEQLTEAALLAGVHEHTSLNLMASINRLDLSRVPRGEAYRMPERRHFVVTDGGTPLSEDTGLYVHTARAAETAYYAVTAVHAGTEVRTLDTNVLSEGVAERVEPVAAVAQNAEGDYVHWTDQVGTHLYPAMASAPGGSYNFRVHGPASGEPRTLIGVLHGALFQYNTPDRDRYAKLDGAEGDAAVRVALDQPLVRGKIEDIDLPRMGYEVGGRGGPPAGWLDAGERVLWTMDWVASRYPVDRSRYVLRGESMGGMGTIALGLGHPDRFAALHAYVPVFGTETVGGPPVWAMMRFNAYRAVREAPGRDFPFIIVTAGRADHIVRWDDKVEFARFANTQRLGFAFYWDAREHAYENVAKYTPVWGEPGGRPTLDLTRFSVRESYPAVANLSTNDDLGTTNPLAVRPADRGPLDAPGMGDLVGTINGQVEWEQITDEPERYEVTLRLAEASRHDTATGDVTPRRAQRFRPTPGSSWAYRVEERGRILVQGTLTADAHGRVLVPAVPLTRAGVRLVIAAPR